MRSVPTLILILTLILTSTELSYQFECLPNGAPIHGVPHDGPSLPSPPASGKHHCPASSIPSAGSLPRSRSQSPSRFSSNLTHPQRVRSRSHPTSSLETPMRLISSDGHEYGLDQLQFFQLTSLKNPRRQFRLRRLTFPNDERLKVLEAHGAYPPVPSQEQIVLSAHDDEVFGILTSDNKLAGIYKHYARISRRARVKLNIQTSRITQLTSDEVEEIPVGSNRRFFNDFRVVHMNYSNRPGEPSGRPRSGSPVSRCMAPPARLLSSNGEGYGLDQLPLIALTSVKNPTQVFKLQEYIFPADNRLLLREALNHYVPMPRQEHIVSATEAGDVFAISEDAKYLAGIYKHIY